MDYVFGLALNERLERILHRALEEAQRQAASLLGCVARSFQPGIQAIYCFPETACSTLGQLARFICDHFDNKFSA